MFCPSRDSEAAGRTGVVSSEQDRGCTRSARRCAPACSCFRQTLNSGGPVSRELTADSYAVYIIHLPLVVAFQFALAGWDVSALTAWGMVLGIAVTTVFPLAAALRRLPGLRRVL